MQRLLLVEDEPIVRFAISTYLSDSGFVVDEAEDLAEARKQLLENDYDVVLTDLRLGGDSQTEGLDVIRMAREKEPKPITILLTAWGSAEVQAEAAALGVDRYVLKPVQLETVISMIAAITQARSSESR